jgi:hypothetical protein
MIKSRRMKCADGVAGIGQIRISYKILLGKPEVKRPLGRYTCGRGLKDNIRMDLRGGEICTGCIWLRIGTAGVFL